MNPHSDDEAMTPHVRHPGAVGRREKDIEHAAYTEAVRRLRLFGSWLGVAISCGVVIGGILAGLGFKRLGPSERIDAEREARIHADSALAVRVGYVEGATSDIRQDLRVVLFVICAQTRKNDPSLVPPECGSGATARGRR